MVSERRQHGNSVRGRGFTLIECLMSLAISAILLVAVAVAFNASLTNYRENEDMFWALNNARQALMRMTNEIRNAGYYDESTFTWYGVSATDPNNQCTLYKPDHEQILYEYRTADEKLYLVKPATNEEYVLCDNVVNAVFTKITPNGWDAKSVQISLTVESDDSIDAYQCTLSAAAMVRRMPEGL